MKTINVPLSAEDLEQLQHGKIFNWRFDDVNICLYQGEEE